MVKKTDVRFYNNNNNNNNVHCILPIQFDLCTIKLTTHN